MKFYKTPEPQPQGSPGRGSGSGKPTDKPADLGLTERRHAIRPLPVPDAVESDGDTDWATFQALISDKPKS
jgi:hypothetical protein